MQDAPLSNDLRRQHLEVTRRHFMRLAEKGVPIEATVGIGLHRSAFPGKGGQIAVIEKVEDENSVPRPGRRRRQAAARQGGDQKAVVS